jgi:hypothetical protein
MDFQIDFGNAPISTGADTGPLYAAIEGHALDLGGEECAFRVRDGGAVHVMTHQVLAALDQCRTFRSLAQHARQIAQRIEGLNGREYAVRPVLDSLIARGLLVAETDVLAALATSDRSAPAPFDAIYVRACERPAQLQRLLESLAAAGREYGTRRRVIVLDDSRGTAAVRAHADAIAAATGSDLELAHVAPERRDALIEQLARDRPALAASYRYALGRRPAGVNSGGCGNNLAALLAAGRRYALLDDDFRFDFRRASSTDAALALGADAEPAAHFFDSTDAALVAGTDIGCDAIARQLDWCGATLGAVLASAPGWRPAPAALAGMSLEQLTARDGSCRVIATCNGHRGSAGTAGSEWMFLLDAESRAAFAQDRERYLRFLEAGSVWIGHAEPHLLRHGSFTPFLLDGSLLLPPTRPEGRNEDLLFGVLCRAAHPESVVLHSDWTIAHVQERERRRSDSLRRADTPTLSQFLADWIIHRQTELRAADPADRLATLAALLRDLAAAPRRIRIDLVREYLTFRRSDLIVRLQRVFHEASDAPIWWQADVRELIAANGRALSDNAAPRLSETPADADAHAAADWLAREVLPFAELLVHWPTMRERAQELAPRLVATR